MKKRILSLLLILCMAVTLLPATAFAEGETVPDGKAKIGNTVYETLEDALKVAQDNDTIYLGAGTYNSYKSTAVKGNKFTLTFIGAGADQTIWNMGTSVEGKPNGGEDGDYSFEGSEKVTFKNMTLRSSVKDGIGEMVTRDNTGFVRINHIVVNNCIIEGRTTYWGYIDTEFHNTTFYAPGHPELNGDQKLGENKKIDYALWTQTGSAFTFDTCEFYAAGKTIHVYRDFDQGKFNVTINFKDCTVISSAPNKSVLNIKDSDNNYTINISGINKVTGLNPNTTTCSRWFQVQSVGEGKNHYATVNIDGEPVWKDGKMVSHAIDTANDKYTYGYKNNAFTITYSEWTKNPDGTKTRTITKTCEHCGYKEETTEIDWNVPKSKTATRLDTNTWTSDVTLSLFDGTTTVVLPNMPGNQTQGGAAYTVGAGSTVEDKMGDAFDFVPGSLKLTVGGTELQSKADGNVTYFGDRAENLSDSSYRFKVVYDSASDKFVWTIHETLNGSQSVQLTYTVKLTNPETAPGTYGVEDLNGEKTLSNAEAEKALFTNAYAVLNAKNSAGTPVKAQEFPKPSVSYTVKSSGSPAIIAAACLNTQDHYSYLIGYSDGTVRPNGRITRAEVATIFFRLLTDDTRQRNWSSENNFSDVSADKWYNNAVSTLCHMGVLGGYSDGTFRPNAPITRAEFAKIAVSFAQINGFSEYGYFTDVDSSDWYAPYVDAAKSVGLIEGYSDGSFKPENKITRAEACTIVNRVLGRKPSKNNMKISDRINWPDCTTDDWFYEAIMEATNSHTYQMGKRAETWNDKLPQRDWAALENNWASAYTGKGGEVH